MNGRGMLENSRKLVAAFLARHPKNRHILIAAATNASALGAVQAAREAKRERHVVVVGQDCIAEAMEEMQLRSSPMIASVSHETRTYGPSLVGLGLALLRGQTVPPYNYVAHRLQRRSELLELVTVE